MEAELGRTWAVGVECLGLAAQFERYLRFQELTRAVNETIMVRDLLSTMANAGDGEDSPAAFRVPTLVGALFARENPD